jgi:hypothetical protein
VLQLPDAHDGPAAPVSPARPGRLSIWVASPAEPRPCLLADLISRVAERHHLQASIALPAPGGWDALNIYPAEVMTWPPDPLDVAVAPADGPAAAPADGPAAAPVGGAAGFPAAESTGSPAHLVRPGPAGPADTTGLDPLALRLALLRRPYREEAALTRDGLEACDAQLRDWRELVGTWAQSPSRPMCAQYVSDFLGALDDDLDVPAALRSLSALAADQEIPDGSKFEAFAYFDRFLGLDLAREVGR